MTELLAELKDACGRPRAASDDEIIVRGQSTWFRGLPAPAEKGTVALGMGRDARVVIAERDIRAVTKDGDYYEVEVSSEANVLLRIEKPLKAIAQPECRCGSNDARHPEPRSQKTPHVELEIGPVQCLICADVVIDNGKQSVKVQLCIPIKCPGSTSGG